MPLLHVFTPDTDTGQSVPFVDGGIKAGFPSPAQDYVTESIDLNRELIQHSETTFYAKVDGDSMMDAGINSGDIVVIDKALEPKDGDFIAAFVDGEFTLKTFKIDAPNHCAWLVPANQHYKPIRITEENDFMVWGVITYTIKRLRH